MESIKSFCTLIINLQRQAEIQAEALFPLNEYFEAEAVRLTRDDEASRMRALRRTIVEQLERVKCSERLARYAQTQINQTASAFTMGMSLGRALVSKGNRLSTLSNSLRSASNEKLPFGNVIVCCTPSGFPRDVEVVSISGLARKSKCLESEVTCNLQQTGSLLFSENAFSLFIDKLVAEIREGRLHLPLPSEKLSKIAEPYCLAFAFKPSKWMPISQPK